MNIWIFIVIIVVLFILLLTKKTREQVAGICSSAFDQTVRKNGNKEKVEALLKEKVQLSNSELREALGVSERSVVRYMDELEKEGKVEQVGNTGRGVTYRLKQ